jgi:two-component system, NtrC family, sensor kinase
MTRSTTLRRELLAAFAIVFAGALGVAMTGTLLLPPRSRRPPGARIYLTLLLVADLAIFFLFGRWLVRTRILFPLDRMVEEAEAIAEGDYARRIPGAGSEEIDRLSASLNRMAERLINHQLELALNIESLERTNRELTEARDELIRAEKMASLGQMAAGVAHEIGNPLAAIMGNVDLLKRGADEELGLAAATLEQVRRIDRIVTGLLDYSRAREARVRPIDVNDGVARPWSSRRPSPASRGVEVAGRTAGPRSPVWRRTRTSWSRCWSTCS